MVIERDEEKVVLGVMMMLSLWCCGVVVQTCELIGKKS